MEPQIKPSPEVKMYCRIKSFSHIITEVPFFLSLIRGVRTKDVRSIFLYCGEKVSRCRRGRVTLSNDRSSGQKVSICSAAAEQLPSAHVCPSSFALRSLIQTEQYSESGGYRKWRRDNRVTKFISLWTLQQVLKQHNVVFRP